MKYVISKFLQIYGKIVLIVIKFLLTLYEIIFEVDMCVFLKAIHLLFRTIARLDAE